MITAWRLLKTKYLADAFMGVGSRRAGGRWNSPGTTAVYCSSHVSLAALEILVHLQSVSLLPAYSVISIRFPEDLVETVKAEELPPDWRSYPGPAGLRARGDEWVKAGRTPVLRVPSAVVPLESNYLLNPDHPSFASLEIGEAEPFSMDDRLLDR